MNSYLESQVADRRKALADIDRRRIVLEAELRAYEDALRHEKGRTNGPHPNGGSPQPSLDLNTPENVALVSAFNRLTDGWKAVLKTLSSRETFRSHDMLTTAHEQGMKTSLPNVRSQLTLFTQRGILRRVAEGEYSVDPIGDLLRMES